MLGQAVDLWRRVSTRDCANQTDASLLRRTSSVTSSDDGAADHGYYARLTPVAYMGFFGEDFAASDEELLDESPGGGTSQGSPWDVLDYPEGGDTQFNFGMHRGSTYLEVLRQRPDYYHWGLQEAEPSAHGLLDLGVPSLRNASCWSRDSNLEGTPSLGRRDRPGQSTLRSRPEQEAKVKTQYAQATG